MTVLAIDTSGEYASVALLEPGGKLTESALHAPDGHSTHLFGEIQTLLRRAGVRLEDVDCFAAAAGPGSFTGVRVALAAAKGLAMALGKPMAAVSNLWALAWFGEAPLRAVAIDARRGNTYTALYNAALEPVMPEILTIALDPWLASLTEAGGEVEIVTAHPAHLAGHTLPCPLRIVAPEHLARAVAHIALAEAVQVDPALTDANYVRRADAEMKWVDRVS